MYCTVLENYRFLFTQVQTQRSTNSLHPNTPDTPNRHLPTTNNQTVPPYTDLQKDPRQNQTDSLH